SHRRREHVRALCLVSSFLFSCYGALRDLHSFPTRRSSDLTATTRRSAAPACGRRRRPTGSAPTTSPATCGAASSTARGCRSRSRSEEHTSELQSRSDLVCRLLLEKKKTRPREPHA